MQHVNILQKLGSNVFKTHRHKKDPVRLYPDGGLIIMLCKVPNSLIKDVASGSRC